MEKETILKFVDASKQKVELLDSSISRFMILSMMAGIYVGFGVALVYSIGAPLKAAGMPGLRALMGASFALALTLVTFAGSELFTGNAMVMIMGNLSKQVSWLATTKVWAASFIGNLAGSLLIALAMRGTGLITKAPLQDFILAVASDKMRIPFSELFFRGILCNMLVCLALWTAARAREETARLILIFWCLFGFIGTGFEHSIANMSLLGMSLFIPHDPGLISWGGYAYNLAVVSLANLIGGVLFIGAAYWYVYGKEQNS